MVILKKKNQAYAKCFCLHQVQDITGMFMLLYWILNLGVNNYIIIFQE